MTSAVDSLTTPIADLDEEDLLGHFEDGPGLFGTICRACSTAMLGNRVVCSSCVGSDLERVRLPRRGTLYSFTRLHSKAGVRIVGYVDLDNGVRTLTDLFENGLALLPDQAVELNVQDDNWFFSPVAKGSDGNE